MFVDDLPPLIPFITRVSSATYDSYDEPPRIIHLRINKKKSDVGVSSSSWGYPLIAGWFVMEKSPSRNGWEIPLRMNWMNDEPSVPLEFGNEFGMLPLEITRRV